MGKLYLASFQFETGDGKLVNDHRLIHADIKNGMNEHGKALLLRDWAEDWFKETYSDVELTGCKINTTLDWVAPDNKVGYSGQKEQSLQKFGFHHTSEKYEKPFSVFFETIQTDDPDKLFGDIVVAGYGKSWEEALIDLDRNLSKDRPQITI